MVWWVVNLPPRDVPWGPVDLNEDIGLFTGYKLTRLKNDFPACQQALNTAGIEFTVLDDRTEGFCERRNRVSLKQTTYPYSAPVRGNCAMAAALVVWEQQAVWTAAKEYLDQPVSRIEHMGVYACRNVGNTKTGRPSQHAFANAIDISGFRLEDGTVIRLARDWGTETPAGEFLKAVQDKSCRLFRGVLGPDYNQAHHDHFHLDMGSYNICR